MVVFSPATYADRAALAPAAVDTSDNAAAPDADDAALVPATMVGQLKNRASGLCLTIPGDTTRDATQVVISQCSDSSKSQRWTLTDTSGQ
ncbi:MAG: RICIN domain-containing protein [Pauljensenia sp.]